MFSLSFQRHFEHILFKSLLIVYIHIVDTGNTVIEHYKNIIDKSKVVEE